MFGAALLIILLIDNKTVKKIGVVSIHLVHTTVLVSSYVALSQAPAEAARLCI